jgi:hypothetical protein
MADICCWPCGVGRCCLAAASLRGLAAAGKPIFAFFSALGPLTIGIDFECMLSAWSIVCWNFGILQCVMPILSPNLVLGFSHFISWVLYYNYIYNGCSCE